MFLEKRAASVDQDLLGLPWPHTGRVHLDISLSWTECSAIMVPCGEVNISSVPLLHIQLEAIAAHVKDELVIDLSLVRFLDSSGLSFLVTAHEELRSRGSRLVIISFEPQFERLCDLSGLTSYLGVTPERPNRR
jgi:anti-anti-sigma factor